jgi:adenylyltransferase/sulfurtransferase
MLLKEIGYKGQLKICKAKVGVIGAGGIGCPVGLYLAAAGVGTLGIFEEDKVDLTNLHRQIAHTTSSIGKPKN